MALAQYKAEARFNELPNDIMVLDKEIYPYSWMEMPDLKCCYGGDCVNGQCSNVTFSLQCCKEVFPDAYTLTFWSATWSSADR